jgi:hypothetical protein
LAAEAEAKANAIAAKKKEIEEALKRRLEVAAAAAAAAAAPPPIIADLQSKIAAADGEVAALARRTTADLVLLSFTLAYLALASRATIVNDRYALPLVAPALLFAARVVEQFHRETFAMRLGLSTQDLRSLDGTTVANDAAAREQMNNVLRDIAGPEGAPPR